MHSKKIEDSETKINICNAINCPFSDPKNGCQRWNVSSSCQIKHTHKEFKSNEYWLFGTVSEEEISLIRNENNAFFLEDSYYQDTLKFQEEYQDWYKGNEFQVKKIT